ncbi:MAG: restriction endonuclease subunit S, partial [Nanoarchaeota archaeon]|nr:restriction endonuclease subunit S [Nanoarchaeota archaeon]
MGKKISWKNVNFGDIEHLEILSSGIIEFKGEKDYLSTKSIQADKIKKAESKITYQKRPSRANMQPKINSVWFARMQGSFKVYCFNETNPDEINKYIFSTGFSGIKVNVERLLPKYVYYYLYSPNFNISKDRYSTGTTQVAITNSNIERISISFPKSKEQQQLIVREIEKQITRLDTAVESLKATNKKLDVYRKSVLDAAFDGDLTDTPSRGVDKISNLVECFRYGTSKKCDLDQTKTPVLRIPNIVGGLIDASELK